MDFRFSLVLTLGAAAGMMLPAFSLAQPVVESNLSAADVKLAASKAIALLQTVGANWSRKQFCVSCHNQILPLMAMARARKHGVPVDEDAAARQLRQSLTQFRLEYAIQGWNPEMTMEEAFTLVAAHDAGVGPNPTAEAFIRLFSRRQFSDGRWLFADNRPPMAYSEITSTAVVLRSLQAYAAPQMANEIAERVKRARSWLERQYPKTTEERTFRLLGMSWASARSDDLRMAAANLLSEQNSDGGWSQLTTLPSDAYSTGEALVALAEAGGIGVDSEAFKRGLTFLVKAQAPDGSWHVKSRIYHPAAVSPPYFESGFPYGHDQFISSAATSWAAMALSLSLPKEPNTHSAASTQVMNDRLEPWAETVLFGNLQRLRQLLSHGFNANSAQGDGTTALMMAAPDPEKVKLLLSAGARVTARAKSQFTALMVASGYIGAAESVRLLLGNGADVEPGIPQPPFNVSAASLAAGAGNTETLKALLAKGANSNRKIVGFWLFEDELWEIPVLRGDSATVDLLATRMGRKELSEALVRSVFGNRPEQVRRLLAHGANVNFVDDIGMTPLLYAASIDYGDTEMIETLLKAGADASIRAKDGSTALDLTRKYNHRELQTMLERALGHK